MAAICGGLDSGFDTVDKSYTFRIQATQPLFSGGRIPYQIRSADFQRDAAYFGFRDTIDLIIATVRTQFYQVLLNRALIDVQEESVKLLQSQLQDQQNRFEAGTVPRFNVLQAQVALSNQQPELITARNNYRIAQLQLARTIGLDFDPRRGNGPPLECVGRLTYTPRRIPLPKAIEIAKERRPFLKTQKANRPQQLRAGGRGALGIFPAGQRHRRRGFSQLAHQHQRRGHALRLRAGRERLVGDLGLGANLRPRQAGQGAPQAIEDHL